MEIRPVVKSKSKVSIPDGVYAGNVSGWVLKMLSQDCFGKEIPLELGVKTMSLPVVVVIQDGIAYCYDRGFVIK